MQPASHSTVLALVEAVDGLPNVSRHRLADLLETVGGTDAFTRPTPTGLEPVEREVLDQIRSAVSSEAVDRWRRDLARLAEQRPDIGLVTVIDDEFPLNLRQVYDRTPFLFHRGSIAAAAERSMAVVGTRRPSPEGTDQAYRLARGLADAGTVVVSGLAAGVDAVAHQAALDANGTTVAVLGHGILHATYPKENAELAERIVNSGGALVSQFWPEQRPTRVTFPMRNVTTSALSLGTVVVEAGETSGARQQARKCLEHGKQLFLLRGLVTQQEWARRYAARPGVVIVDDVSEVLGRLDALLPEQAPVQLAFG